MRIAVYNRVSSKSQINNHSLELQKKECEKYCKYLNEEAEIFYFIDKGISGATLDRPALQNLMDRVKLKEFSSVVVFDLARLGRSVIDTLSLIKTLQINDIKFHSVKEKIDTSTPMGIFSLTILASIAQLERETIKERMRSTRNYLVSMNRVIGKVPIGFEMYTEIGENGKIIKMLVENEYEQNLMARIRKLKRHYSIREICSILNNEGTKLRAGIMHPVSVWRILNKKKVEKKVKSYV